MRATGPLVKYICYLFDDTTGQTEPMVGAVYDAELSGGNTLYAVVRDDAHLVFARTLQGASGKFGRVAVFECNAGGLREVAQRISCDEAEPCEVELCTVLCIRVETIGNEKRVVLDILAYDKPWTATQSQPFSLTLWYGTSILCVFPAFCRFRVR